MVKSMRYLYENVFVKAITMYNKHAPLKFYLKRRYFTSLVVSLSVISLNIFFKLSSMHSSDKKKTLLHTYNLKNSAPEYTMHFRNGNQRALSWN